VHRSGIIVTVLAVLPVPGDARDDDGPPHETLPTGGIGEQAGGGGQAAIEWRVLNDDGGQPFDDLRPGVNPSAQGNLPAMTCSSVA